MLSIDKIAFMTKSLIFSHNFSSSMPCSVKSFLRAVMLHLLPLPSSIALLFSTKFSEYLLTE